MNQETAEKIASALDQIAETQTKHFELVREHIAWEHERATKAEKQLMTMFGGGLPFGPPGPIPIPDPPPNISGPAGPPGARRRRG